METIDRTEHAPRHHAATVIDMPNLECHARELNAGKSGPASRIGIDAIAGFTLEHAQRNNDASCTAFIKAQSKKQHGWITALRTMGVGVFARPEGDIDDNLVEHVESLSNTIDRLNIVTHDKELIERCLRAVHESALVTVLGFEEFSSRAMSDDRIEFVDLGNVNGALSSDLLRQSLDRLPEEGALLPPLAKLAQSRNALRRRLQGA